MNPFPKPSNEKQRLEALKSYNILNANTEKDFDFITLSIASLCEVPMCTVTLINEDEVLLVSPVGIEGLKVTSRTGSPSQFTILEKDLLEVPDIQLDDRFSTLTHIGDHNIRFYAGYPLIDTSGNALGSLNIYDRYPRSLSEMQKYFLKQAAKHATDLIVQRRERQEAQQYERLFKVWDSLSGVILSDGSLFKVNPACSTLLGWSEAELLDKTMVDLVHPDDLMIAADLLGGAQKGNTGSSVLVRVITKDQEVKYVDWMGLPEEGTDFVYFVGRDMTPLIEKNALMLESDKRFRAFFENSQSLLCMHDLGGNFISVNKTGADMVGYEVDDIVTMSLYDIIPSENHSYLKEYLTHIADKGHASGKMLVVREDGEKRVWLFNNVLEVDEQGNKYVIGNAVDLTDHYRMAKELEEAKKIAEKASKAKSEFLANMSHEIRTPLNGIVGFTDLMLKTSLNETQGQYASIINQSTKTLMGIINDILDFSKIEAGELKLNIEKVDLQDLVSQSCSMIAYPLGGKGLELLFDFSEDLPRYIWADQIRLQQVLVNLLSNAVKFTEKGEVKLSIKKLEDLSDNKAKLRFEVHDTGVGIQDDRQQEIFDAFKQEDNSITKRYGGTGLGLTISNRLLKAGGSSLQLESEQGKGSCFSFDLTLKVENEYVEDEDLTDIKKVLIVDDNDANRLIVRCMLELREITVDEAENGVKAISMVQHNPAYDAIIVDYHMSDMDGVETIKKIKRMNHIDQTEQPFIILYSSSDNESFQAACDSLKIQSRLVKPVKMRELYRELAQNKNRNLSFAKGKDQIKIKQSDTQIIKILIAEDNEINLFLTKTLIQQIIPNASIVEAKDGQEAIAVYHKEQPDLILMDIQMPKMNGLEATKEIRRQEKSTPIPIIALTAGNMIGEREKCFEAGMNDFMVKPIMKETFSTILDEWLHHDHDNSKGLPVKPS